ncbi:MAG: hypothetical protein GX146_11525 [Myxococcales bacterium]|nr:hypothetical protein [Myxococcales bacterium]
MPDSCEQLHQCAEERSRDNATSADIHAAIVAYEKLLSQCVGDTALTDTAFQYDAFEYNWRLLRVIFMAAEDTSDAGERMRWLVKGERLAEELMASHPERVEGFYYAALLKGRRAYYSGLGFGALALAKQVEKIGLRAVEISPEFENAGPLRFLAMLYAKAPPWPTGMGDMDRAYDYAHAAIDLAHYPLNYLTLAEVLIEDREYAQAKEMLNRVLVAPKKGQWAYEGEKWRAYIHELLNRLENK